MDLLIDTQVLVWVGTGSSRISMPARHAIADIDNACFVSVVTACEFADLNERGRFGAHLRLSEILMRIDARILDYPASAWRVLEVLPQLHRDPVDRMLVAHAIHADLALITADRDMRRYPVRTIW